MFEFSITFISQICKYFYIIRIRRIIYLESSSNIFHISYDITVHMMFICVIPSEKPLLTFHSILVIPNYFFIWQIFI